MFFESTEDFKKYCAVNASFEFSEMEIFLKDVDRSVLKKYLGQEFLDELQESYDDRILEVKEPDDEEKKTIAAIEKIKICTPYFALMKWAPSGQLSISNSGIRIASNDTYKTAFQWQIRELIESWNESGTVALDDLLEFLDENLEDYDTYAASEEFRANKELFVHSSKIFIKHFSSMISSRSTFDKLRSIIRKVEEMDVKAVLLPDYYAELKDKLQHPPESVSGSDEDPEPLSDADKKIISMIEPAIVHLTIARAIKELAATITPEGFIQFDNTGTRDTIDNKRQADSGTLYSISLNAERDGRAYLKMVVDYLEAHKTDYETFASDDLYEAPETEDGSQNPDVKLFNGL